MLRTEAGSRNKKGDERGRESSNSSSTSSLPGEEKHALAKSAKPQRSRKKRAPKPPPCAPLAAEVNNGHPRQRSNGGRTSSSPRDSVRSTGRLQGARSPLSMSTDALNAGTSHAQMRHVDGAPLPRGTYSNASGRRSPCNRLRATGSPVPPCGTKVIGSLEGTASSTLQKPLQPSKQEVKLTKASVSAAKHVTEKLSATITKLNEDNGFEHEFTALDSEMNAKHPADKCSIALKHRQLNRYLDILPYDHNRVVLHSCTPDYINASLLKPVIHGGPSFIASQGPKSNTIRAFWEMVLEYKCGVVVMVTNTIELSRIKCEQYWPSEDEPLVFPQGEGFENGFSVALMSQHDALFWSERTFKISPLTGSKHGSRGDRIVTQFHFTDWPDYGIPSSAGGFVDFVAACLNANPKKSKRVKQPPPLLVHCSAGIGRTGTFCVAASLLAALMKTSRPKSFSFDMKAIFRSLRKQRFGMIQTASQYEFAYQSCLIAAARVVRTGVGAVFFHGTHGDNASRASADNTTRSEADSRKSTLNGVDVPAIGMGLRKRAYTSVHRNAAWDDFVSLFTETPLVVPTTLNDCMSYGEVDAVVSVLTHLYGSQALLLPFAFKLSEWGISGCESKNLIYRKNTLATKIVTASLKVFGQGYLHDLLNPLIQAMLSTPDRSYEINPSMLAPKEHLQRNIANLRKISEIFLERILGSLPDVPMAVRLICFGVARATADKFPESKATGVANGLFLRFISPAIISPKFHGVCDAAIPPKVTRGLLFISKTIQAAANPQKFSGFKEEFMAPMNDLVQLYNARTMDFIDKVSQPPSILARLTVSAFSSMGINLRSKIGDPKDASILGKKKDGCIYDSVSGQELSRLYAVVHRYRDTISETLSDQHTSHLRAKFLRILDEIGDPQKPNASPPQQWTAPHKITLNLPCLMPSPFSSLSLETPSGSDSSAESALPRNYLDSGVQRGAIAHPSWHNSDRDYEPVPFTAAEVHGDEEADPDISALAAMGDQLLPRNGADKSSQSAVSAIAAEATIAFNTIDDMYAVDRRSFDGRYKVIDGVPQNPLQRTGISGRGILRRWGPNHFTRFIVTRWKHATADGKDERVIRNKQPLMQVLLIDHGGRVSLPEFVSDIEPSLPDALREYLPLDRSTATSLKLTRSTALKKIKTMQDAVENVVQVYKGAATDARNTDNAWVEHHALWIHLPDTDATHHLANRAVRKTPDEQKTTRLIYGHKDGVELNSHQDKEARNRDKKQSGEGEESRDQVGQHMPSADSDIDEMDNNHFRFVWAPMQCRLAMDEADLDILQTVASKSGAFFTDQLPRICRNIIQEVERRGLLDEGLYRISGRASSIKALKNALVEGHFEALKLEAIPTLTSLLKKFLRDMDPPLLTYTLYDDFLACLGAETEEGKKQMFSECLRKLPVGNFRLLRTLVHHLKRVAKEQCANRMSLENLALLFGPTMMKSPEGIAQDMADNGKQIMTAKALLLLPESVWGESVTFQNSKSFRKSRKSFAKRSLSRKLLAVRASTTSLLTAVPQEENESTPSTAPSARRRQSALDDALYATATGEEEDDEGPYGDASHSRSTANAATHSSLSYASKLQEMALDEGSDDDDDYEGVSELPDDGEDESTKGDGDGVSDTESIEEVGYSGVDSDSDQSDDDGGDDDTSYPIGSVYHLDRAPSPLSTGTTARTSTSTSRSSPESCVNEDDEEGGCAEAILRAKAGPRSRKSRAHANRSTSVMMASGDADDEDEDSALIVSYGGSNGNTNSTSAAVSSSARDMHPKTLQEVVDLPVGEEWFCAKIEREKLVQLRDEGTAGQCLVYPSRTNKNGFCISVRLPSKKVWTSVIEVCEKTKRLKIETENISFLSFASLAAYYTNHNLPCGIELDIPRYKRYDSPSHLCAPLSDIDEEDEEEDEEEEEDELEDADDVSEKEYDSDEEERSDFVNRYSDDPDYEPSSSSCTTDRNGGYVDVIGEMDEEDDAAEQNSTGSKVTNDEYCYTGYDEQGGYYDESGGYYDADGGYTDADGVYYPPPGSATVGPSFFEGEVTWVISVKGSRLTKKKKEKLVKQWLYLEYSTAQLYDLEDVEYTSPTKTIQITAFSTITQPNGGKRICMTGGSEDLVFELASADQAAEWLQALQQAAKVTATA